VTNKINVRFIVIEEKSFTCIVSAARFFSFV
jgi:hypothetical protein